jgi:nucleotide-binding universal stress UspA family protein
MFSLRKILIPIDFSDRCRGAARFAAPSLATHFSSEVTLLHVLPRYGEFGAAELGISLGENWIAQRKVQARQDLDSFLSKELSQLPVKKVVAEGDPARCIVEYAHSEHTDLILMPTHGYGPFRRLLLGSVTSKVLHDSDCPVWTGVHLDKEPSVEPLVLGHILCAVDLEEHSTKTLRWASRLATEFKAKLTVVHVAALLDGRTQSHYFAPQWRDYVMDEARADIQTLLQNVGTCADVDLELGDIVDSVCFAAERLNADLLVVGRGSAADGSGRFRTHAYAVIRRSPCPVVSV